MHRIARQTRRYLRLPALVLLMLAVLINPLFASVGDLHEAISGDAEHLHLSQQHALTQDAVQDADGKGGDLLHAMMHAAHCCGHLNAIPATYAPTPVSLVSAPAPQTVAAHSASATASSEIRPPIAL